MKIQIQSCDIRVTKTLRSHVELRLGFALSRFAENIDHVTVHLSNSNVHHSPAEKRCRIQVGLARSVNVQETDPDVFTAFNRAVDRAARSVARIIKLEQERQERISKPVTKKNSLPTKRAPKKKRKVASKRSTKLKKKRSSVPPHKS